MLNFLGCGGAFAFKYKNNSAYFIKDRTMYLFDCGESVFSTIMEKDLLDKFDKLTVFITHLHSDHCGSLATLVPYVFFRKGTKTTIVYDAKENLAKLLELMYVNSEKYEILNSKEFSDFPVESFEQEHELNSFGYMFKLNDKTIYFSGDTIKINQKALELMNNGKIDFFYHDATVNVTVKHVSIYEIFEKVKPEFHDRIYIMHYDDEIKNAAIELGLKIVAVEG